MSTILKTIFSMAIVMFAIAVLLLQHSQIASAASACGGTLGDDCRSDCNVRCYRTPDGVCYKCITDAN